MIIHKEFYVQSRHCKNKDAKKSCRRNEHEETTVVALHNIKEKKVRKGIERMTFQHINKNARVRLKIMQHS